MRTYCFFFCLLLFWLMITKLSKKKKQFCFNSKTKKRKKQLLLHEHDASCYIYFNLPSPIILRTEKKSAENSNNFFFSHSLPIQNYSFLKFCVQKEFWLRIQITSCKKKKKTKTEHIFQVSSVNSAGIYLLLFCYVICILY